MYWTECYMLVKNDSYENFEAAMGTTSGKQQVKNGDIQIR